MFSTELVTLNNSVNQSVSQSVSQPLSQSATQSVSQPVSPSVSQSVSQSVHLLVSKSKLFVFFFFWEQSVDLNHFMCSPGKKLYSINAKI